jgi:hypothetical protein
VVCSCVAAVSHLACLGRKGAEGSILSDQIIQLVQGGQIVLQGLLAPR